MIEACLVIGYGNALRTDDGLGWHAAERLRDDPRLAGATVLTRHQLTPELAVDVSAAAFVVFVDAGTGAPGELVVASVEPSAEPSLAWTHHVGPALLLGLARELYGRAPTAVTVSVGVQSMEVGDGLSPRLEQAMPRVVDAVAALIREHTPSETVGGPRA